MQRSSSVCARRQKITGKATSPPRRSTPYSCSLHSSALLETPPPPPPAGLNNEAETANRPGQASERSRNLHRSRLGDLKGTWRFYSRANTARRNWKKKSESPPCTPSQTGEHKTAPPGSLDLSAQTVVHKSSLATCGSHL